VSAASLDRLLAALIVGLAVSGAISLVAGAPGHRWIFVAHDVLAGLLAVAVVTKLVRSVPRAVRGRRWGRLAVASLVTVAALASLVAGFAWVAGGALVWVDLPFIRWSLLTVHVVAGLALVPFVVVHLLPRRWRVLRMRTSRRPSRSSTQAGGAPRISRRAVLTAAGYGAMAMLLVGGATTLDTLRGGVRRFTGSRWLPSGPPGVPTTFLGEPVPAVDAASWRLHIAGRVDHASDYDLAALAAVGTTHVTAVLDCTAGWAIEATWSGVPLRAVLRHAGASDDTARIDVVSVTGWRTTLDAAAIDACLLAWAEGGRPISTEHGAPLRLVAPDRRGLEWVKWIDRIEVA
jgi:DMSO/TMAO reductase YedYZ molybdopterin-dependent catalytic subunit